MNKNKIKEIINKSNISTKEKEDIYKSLDEENTDKQLKLIFLILGISEKLLKLFGII